MRLNFYDVIHLYEDGCEVLYSKLRKLFIFNMGCSGNLRWFIIISI